MQLETPLDQLLATSAHVRLLRALAGLPRGFSASARELARRAGVAHTTAGRALRALAAEGVVHVQHVGRADLHELNDAHVLAPQIRTLFETEAGLRAHLLEYMRSEVPRRVGRAEAAFLFGSASRAETRTASDVDVAVIAPERPDTELERELSKLADAVRDRFGAELNVIVAAGGRGRRARPALWRRIERDGIPLLPGQERRG